MTKQEPIVLWYKKTLKQSGKPIIVQQGRGKNMKEYTVDSFCLDNCRIEMSFNNSIGCLLYTSPSPRDRTRSRMPSSA